MDGCWRKAKPFLLLLWERGKEQHQVQVSKCQTLIYISWGEALEESLWHRLKSLTPLGIFWPLNCKYLRDSWVIGIIFYHKQHRIRASTQATAPITLWGDTFPTPAKKILSELLSQQRYLKKEPVFWQCWSPRFWCTEHFLSFPSCLHPPL